MTTAVPTDPDQSTPGDEPGIEPGPAADGSQPATRHHALDRVRPGDVVVAIGASGSGKSTVLAGVRHQIVGLDALRALISAPGDQAATADAVLLQHLLLTMRLRRPAPTFIDNVSSSGHHRRHLVDLAHAHGRRAVALWVDTPVETCVRRNALRPGPLRVPEDVLRDQHREIGTAAELLPLLRAEGFDEIIHHRGV